MSDDLTNHYKERYLFYKGQCQKLTSYLQRVQKILEEPQFPTLPLHSPTLTVKQRSVSPILGGNSKYPTLRKCLNLDTDSATDSDDDFDGNEGSNKWECIPSDEADSYLIENAREPKHGDQADLRPSENTTASPPKQSSKKFITADHRKSVGKNIHSVRKRMVPEHTCTKCSDYMEVSGLGENIWNKASKHRRQQKEPNSSQGTLAHEQNKNHQKVKINGRWVPKLGL